MATRRAPPQTAVNGADPSPDPLHPANEKRSILALPDGSEFSIADLSGLGDDGELIEETATDRVYALLQGAGTDASATLKVYRKNPDGIMAYCASYTPAEFEAGGLDMVRDNFGHGNFELRLYGKNPAGRFGVLRRITEQLAEVRNPAPRPGAAAAPDTGLAQVLAMMAQQQSMILEKLAAPPAPPVAPVDPMAQMSAMFGMMAQMREAMGLNVPAQSNKSSIGEIVSAIRELRGAAEELTPEKEESDPMTSALKIMGPIIGQAVANQQQQNAAPPVQFMPGIQTPGTLADAAPPVDPAQAYTPPTAQAATLDQGNPANPENAAMINPLLIIKLKTQLTALVNMAKNGAPTADGATVIVQNIPDQFIDLLDESDWFEVLSQFAPEVVPYREWLTAARDAALLEIFGPENENPA